MLYQKIHMCRFCESPFKKTAPNDVYCNMKCRLLHAVKKMDNGCWFWKYGKDKNGYGLMTVKNKMQRASRMAFQTFREPIPEKFLVCHTCDNPWCINPDHLFLASNLENMRDKIQKGRDKVRGEENVHAILTNEKVKEIRRLYEKESISISDISKLFGIGISHVCSVVYRKIWRHI